MSAIPSRKNYTPLSKQTAVTALCPDFPYNYSKLLTSAKDNNSTLFSVDPSRYGTEVAIVGGGISGIVAGYELMRMGLKPVFFEASDRIGGRLYSYPRGSDNEVIAELGAMRFPVAGKALNHYFEKVGMNANKAPFPNPGTDAAVSTVVDYLGQVNYYEPGDQENFPTPPEYTALEDKFIVDFLNSAPYNLDEMVGLMTDPITPEKQQAIKSAWNALINPVNGEKSWDYRSFFECLSNDPSWSFSEIEMFGQIGFGTGGWNTDYPNCFLEVLRVMYMSLDVDHELMYDGANHLPMELWSRSPESMGDSGVHWPSGTSLQSLTVADGHIPYNQQVNHIIRESNGTFTLRVENNNKGGVIETHNFPAVVYAGPIRLLDKMRHNGAAQDYQAMTETLFGPEMWESIMYTHYMQSTKVFAATDTPFWTQRDNSTPPKRRMSVTLSDRLTRGTYLVDYSGALEGKYKGSGIFLSYTWNDDSLKLLNGTSEDMSATHLTQCLAVLKDIYPDVDFGSELTVVNGSVELSWENYRYYLGGFKMNLPGQYVYQQRIFSQFMSGVSAGTPDAFVLVGDDVSWTAGWTEGAVTSAINAVNKMAVVFGGGDSVTPGPISEWDLWKPIDRVEVSPKTRVQG